MGNKLSLEELTAENILALSEKEVSDLLTIDIHKLPKEERTYYVNLISKAFDFRSISAKNKKLKGDLGMFGFKFFPIPNDNNFIMGIKRKAA